MTGLTLLLMFSAPGAGGVYGLDTYGTAGDEIMVSAPKAQASPAPESPAPAGRESLAAPPPQNLNAPEPVNLSAPAPESPAPAERESLAAPPPQNPDAPEPVNLTAPAPGTLAAPEPERPAPPAPQNLAASAPETLAAPVPEITVRDIIMTEKNRHAGARQEFRKPARKPGMIEGGATYRVKPGDLLEISIWKEPDMRREMLVLPDGTISYPLAGHVHVDGMTPQEIEDLLARRLSRYFKDPFLNVIVKQTTGNQIYVLGEVRNPGAFTITQPIDVMQALSLAGGLSEYADKSEIVVLRRLGNGKQEVINFKYSSVQRGRNLATNVTLLGGDTVVVPERGLF